MIQSRALLRFRAAASNARAPRRAQSTAATPPPLAGTVGEHHTLVLLHTSTPITALAAKPTTAAALTRVLGPGYGVQLAWAPRDEPAPSVLRARSADDAGEGESEAPRVHALSVFRPGAPVLHAPLPAGPAVDAAAVQALLANPDDAAQNAADAPAHYLYVCTHGTRDCRCGETGGAVVAALRAARARFAEGAKTEEERELWAKKVHIGEVAHVGGHKCVRFLHNPGRELTLCPDTPQMFYAILPAIGECASHPPRRFTDAV
jgi:hypothetical protein